MVEIAAIIAPVPIRIALPKVLNTHLRFQFQEMHAYHQTDKHNVAANTSADNGGR